MKCIAGIILFLLVINTGLAQNPKQYYNWYFGFKAGLNWNSGSPQAVLNNVLDTDEGCASISDSSGNLLFYTNGESIINRNHTQMLNGGGLYGNISGTQTALIVPDIKEDSVYYVFTVPATMGINSGGHSGLYYSIVDMRLDNTLGAVTVKNVMLTDNVTEKLTATRHRNGIDAWIIAHKWNSDEYYSFLLTCEGFKGPVVSHAGRIMGDDGTGFYFPALGCITVSPQRNKIAAIWTVMNSAFMGTSNIDILNFDQATGVLEADTFDTHPSTPTYDTRGYGVSFSPSGEKLYVSENGTENGIAVSDIFQYDLTKANAMGSEIEIANSFVAYGTLQTGPDGKIYCAKLNGSSYLSCIRNPEGSGSSCNFEEIGVGLSGQVSTWGLPNNWDLYEYRERYDIFTYADTLLCNQNRFALDVTYAFPLFTVTYEWDDGSKDPLRYVSSSGEYNVKIFVDCDTIFDTVTVRFDTPQIMLPDDQSVCDGDSLILDASLEGSQYAWNNGSTDSTVYAKLTGTYMVTVTDSSGCQVSDTVTLDFRNCVCRVFVPNTFTANDDGKNDRFSPVSYCDFLSYEFTVYNRWGQNIFQSTDMNAQWNGGDHSPSGIYCWTLRYSWFDGRGVKKASKTGTVALLR